MKENWRGGILKQQSEIRGEGDIDVEWQEIVSHLKTQCPVVNHRLVVRRLRLKDSNPNGITHISDDEQTITIIVNTRQPHRAQIDTLIHEWGHALWLDEVDWHDDRWGKHHSRAYRAWEELLDY